MYTHMPYMYISAAVLKKREAQEGSSPTRIGSLRVVSDAAPDTLFVDGGPTSSSTTTTTSHQHY